MEPEQALQFPLCIHHWKHGDWLAAVVFHLRLDRVHREQLEHNRDRMSSHQSASSERPTPQAVISLLIWRKVSVGNQANQKAGLIGIFHPAATDRTLREPTNDLRQCGLQADARQRLLAIRSTQSW